MSKRSDTTKGQGKETHCDVRDVIGKANAALLALRMELRLLNVLSTGFTGLEGHAAIVAEEGRLSGRGYGGRHDRVVRGRVYVEDATVGSW